MIKKIKKMIKKQFKKDMMRLKHSYGVSKTATKLAKRHHVRIKDAKIAALFHDYFRNETIENMLDFLDSTITKKYQNHQFVYHGFAAAKKLEQDLNCNNEDILNAIRYHVLGRKKMSKLEKIIFISDACEPNRKYQDKELIFKLAKKNLDLATLKVLSIGLDYTKKLKIDPHFDQVEAYEYYKKK